MVTAEQIHVTFWVRRALVAFGGIAHADADALAVHEVEAALREGRVAPYVERPAWTTTRHFENARSSRYVWVWCGDLSRTYLVKQAAAPGAVVFAETVICIAPLIRRYVPRRVAS